MAKNKKEGPSETPTVYQSLGSEKLTSINAERYKLQHGLRSGLNGNMVKDYLKKTLSVQQTNRILNDHLDNKSALRLLQDQSSPVIAELTKHDFIYKSQKTEFIENLGLHIKSKNSKYAFP